jgi:hypothetical protein
MWICKTFSSRYMKCELSFILIERVDVEQHIIERTIKVISFKFFAKV